MINWMTANKDTILFAGDLVFCIIKLLLWIPFFIAVSHGDVMTVMYLGVVLLWIKLDDIQDVVKKDD